MATEKLIHLTFKNPILEKDPVAALWLERMSQDLNEEAIKMAEDMATYGRCFFVGQKGRIHRVKPEDYYQIPRPLEVGMRVQGFNLSSHLTEWYLDSIDHQKNSGVVVGISPKWDTPLRVVITNLNHISEWTQN